MHMYILILMIIRRRRKENRNRLLGRRVQTLLVLFRAISGKYALVNGMSDPVRLLVDESAVNRMR